MNDVINKNETFINDVKEGLNANPKRLLSKYFYDERGDELFVRIMKMPEYYLTDAEFEILSEQGEEIIKSFDIGHRKLELVELGAGDGTKTIQLLKKLEGKLNFTYMPIDISQNALDKLEQRLAREVPDVKVQTLQGDYFTVLNDIVSRDGLKVVLFLGSNLGNMLDVNANRFIKQLSERLKSNDKILLGVDLKKDADIILPAYNDATGITRDFNLNLLTRINRELGGNFKVEQFEHKPLYNEEKGQAESYIESTTDQDVTIEATGETYHFDKGERIHMEISRKYDEETVNNVIEDTGLQIKEIFTDSKGYFSDFLLEKQ